jgi:glutamine synthetase
LPNIRNATEAFKALKEPVNVNMLTEVLGIFTKDELSARYEVLSERYTKDMLIEANTLRTMLFTSVMPAAYETRKSLADSVNALKNAGVGVEPEKSVLGALGEVCVGLQDAGEKLIGAIEKVASTHHGSDTLACLTLLPIMQRIRELTDKLEQTVPDKAWPFPKYTELLFSI